MCVIAVRKLQEFFVKSSSTFFIFFDDDAYAFTSTRRNFLNDDARDSTSTTSDTIYAGLTVDSSQLLTDLSAKCKVT